MPQWCFSGTDDGGCFFGEHGEVLVERVYTIAQHDVVSPVTNPTNLYKSSIRAVFKTLIG